MPPAAAKPPVPNPPAHSRPGGRSPLDFLSNNAYLLLALATLFWGGNMVLGRYVAGHVPPVALAQVRWTAAFLIVLPFCWRYLVRDIGEIRRHIGLISVMSGAGIAAYNTLSYVGLQYATAISGVLVVSTAPLLIGFWSFVLYRDRMTPAQIGGVTLSLVGVAFIIGRGDPAVLAHLKLNPGDVLIVVAVFAYALYSALLKQRPQVHPMSFIAVTMGLGQAMLWPFFAWELASGLHLHADALTFASLAYVVLFASIAAYFAFNRGVELIGPNRAGPFFHLIPVFGSALAVLFLGERPAWYHGVGYVLILCGIAITQRRRPAA